MDEPRAYRSTTVRVKEQSPNEILGLLCSWNGNIRNDQREPAVPRRHRPNGFREGVGRETSSPRSEVQEGSVEDVGTVLGVSTENRPTIEDVLRCLVFSNFSEPPSLEVDEGMEDRW
jgi:hypothetical protein